MLAQKPMASEVNFNNHRLRKFPSHYFSEMENDSVSALSSLQRNGADISTGGSKQIDASSASGADVDIREANNWIDKFHTGFTGILDENPNTGVGHQIARATLTDGNYGVGRSGYESAYKTLLHYPEFLDVGKLNNYIYRGGAASDDGTAKANTAYVTADVAHSNQVYGMKIDDARIDEYDAANKGQKFGANDIIPKAGQGAGVGSTDGDLDFNGQGGADGSLFAERSQFYQNEAKRFASGSPIDTQWRNPDQHNYVSGAGNDVSGTPDTNGADTTIFRQYQRGNWPTSLSSTISNILEAQPAWTESTRYQPIEYKNGLVEASKCHQCCNTDHNCNWNWQPTTKVDWNFAYVWRYQAIDGNSNTPTSGTMGVGANGRAWEATHPTLSQDLADFHFNFPPYAANHAVNRGNAGATLATADLGDPAGSSVTMSDSDSTYTTSTGTFFTHAL